MTKNHVFDLIEKIILDNLKIHCKILIQPFGHQYNVKQKNAALRVQTDWLKILYEFYLNTYFISRLFTMFTVFQLSLFYLKFVSSNRSLISSLIIYHISYQCFGYDQMIK